ncbi:MAG: hypothetical protein KKI06_11040, partial [Euryarchaeota archaeon]|nr:hypothetical protein [Euryarchaeota archaeon]
MKSASGSQQSGKQCILEDSFDHFQLFFPVKSNRPSKKYMIQQIREHIAEERLTKRLKEFNKEFLFSWTDGSSQSDIYISE